MRSRALGILALTLWALSPKAGHTQETPPEGAAASDPPAVVVPDSTPATSPTTPPPAAPVRYRLWAGVGVAALGVASLGGALYFARRVSRENDRAADLALAYEDAVIHGQHERAKEICAIFDTNGACLNGELEDADAAGAAAAGNFNLTLTLGLGLSVVGAGLIAWELLGAGTGDGPGDTGKAPDWRLDVLPLSGGGLVTAGWQF